MEKDTLVYYHRRKDTNEVFYVGIGKEGRPYVSQNRNTWWWNIVNKVGYDVEIVHTDLTWDEAVEYEIKYIKEFGRADLGLGNLVNLTDGGEGTRGCSHYGEDNSFYGKNHTEEYKKEASIRMTGLLVGEKNGMYGRTHTKEAIDKIIENRRSYEGENNPFFGKTHTQEIIDKIIENNKTRTLPKSWYENMRLNSWGRERTEEEKQKQSLVVRGEKNGNATLKKEDVLWIRKHYIPRHKEYGRPAISKKFGISTQMISLIINRTNWKHI